MIVNIIYGEWETHFTAIISTASKNVRHFCCRFIHSSGLDLGKIQS